MPWPELFPSAPGISPRSRESRLTYFARDRSLGITPAQKATDHSPGVNPMGRDRDPNETLHCFACHVTSFSEQDLLRLDVATMRADRFMCDHRTVCDAVAARVTKSSSEVQTFAVS